MVAYSFKARFAEQIEDGRKRQTIRAHRKRHAYPGERLQLYTGMRTRQCRKLLDPDPVCLAVDPIRIRVPATMEPAAVYCNPLGQCGYVTPEFAALDGFEGPEDFTRFWYDTHGAGTFEGVVVKWSVRP